MPKCYQVCLERQKYIIIYMIYSVDYCYLYTTIVSNYGDSN